MNEECGIAVFVKTPELSPVKTRLGAQIGQSRAVRFYELSCSVIAENLQSLNEENSNLFPYWAVAEEEGLRSERWSSLPRLYQGTGELGERLHTIYSTLLKRHGAAVLLGADSPQLSTYDLIEAIRILLGKDDGSSAQKSVIGRASDGGFYLFGSSIDFPKEFWTSIPYSVSDTEKRLSAKALDFGRVYSLKEEFDVDTADELKELLMRFPECCEEAKAHSDLMYWLLSLPHEVFTRSTSTRQNNG